MFEEQVVDTGESTNWPVDNLHIELELCCIEKMHDSGRCSSDCSNSAENVMLINLESIFIYLPSIHVELEKLQLETQQQQFLLFESYFLPQDISLCCLHI